jgi:phosphoribosylamine--glycine ligase
MKILVIGGGGREHALVWKIDQSPLVEKIYCAPGNPGTAEKAENIPIAVEQIDKLLAFAKNENIDLTVVGPEVPLSLGIVDLFQEYGLKIFGPNRAAARIESSKAF